MSGGWRIYTVYRNPRDFPGKHVVRSIAVNPGTVWVSRLVRVCDTLEEAREAIPRGLMLTPRDVGDDPVIVESWL